MEVAPASPPSPMILPGHETASTSPLMAASALVGSVRSAPTRQTSLLTSALGGSGSTPSRATPIHPFLSSNSPAPPGAAKSGTVQGDAQLEHVLDSWDRAWMGTDHSNSASTSQRSTPAQGTSPGAGPHPPVHHHHTANGVGRTTPTTVRVHGFAPVPPAAPGLAIHGRGGGGSGPGPGASAPLGRSLGSRGDGSPALAIPPLPATPPPPHRALGALANPSPNTKGPPTSLADAGRAQSGSEEEEDDPVGVLAPDDVDTPLPATSSGRGAIPIMPSTSHRPPAAPAAHTMSSGGRSGAPPLHGSAVPAIPNGAKDASDFASVFFSPLPYSYLNSLARSDSTDQILVNSAGSPDITLRNGRLTASTSVTHMDWPVEVPVAGGLEGTAISDGGDAAALLLAPGSTLDKEDDVGDGGAGAPGLSTTPPPAAWSLVQQSLAAARANDAAMAAASPMDEGTYEGEDGGQCGRRDHHQSGQRCSGQCDLRPNGGERGQVSSNGGSEPHLLARSGSPPRSALSSLVPHPAMGSPMGSPSPSANTALGLAGLPVLPGGDHLQGSGFMSIAAAVEPNTRLLRLVAAAAMIPHVDKADKGGEDAYCIVKAGLGSIGVADGVSGWAEEGIDPAEYSRTLMRFCAEALEEAGSSADAREVIRYAHKSTVMPGSSTVCLALMKPAGRLQVANLGDSGVRIIRDGRIIFASAAQQHMFNMPYQLSHPSIIDSPDDADSADVTTVDVLPGDVVVMATDGLYDNMFDEEICAICCDVVSRRRRALLLGSHGGDAPPSPRSAAAAAEDLAAALYSEAEAEALAVQITRTAHRYAQNPYQRTPWSVASCEQGYSWARYFAKGGGKMDDCTVIVSFIQAVPV